MHSQASDLGLVSVLADAILTAHKMRGFTVRSAEHTHLRADCNVCERATTALRMRTSELESNERTLRGRKSVRRTFASQSSKFARWLRAQFERANFVQVKEFCELSNSL